MILYLWIKHFILNSEDTEEVISFNESIIINWALKRAIDIEKDIKRINT